MLKMMMMMMNISLSGPFLLLLLFLCSSPVSGLGSVVQTYYTHISRYETWVNAQSYCRRYHTDLATIYRESDKDRINIKTYDSWIGLRKDGYSWKWIDGTVLSLETSNQRKCAFIYSDTTNFYGDNCEVRRFFFCHEIKKGGDLDFKFIPEAKTWSEARQFCQVQHDDLANFRAHWGDWTETQQDFPVWIGLQRDGQTWKWSTGLSDYTKWDSGEPDNDGDCVTLSSKKEEMATQNCSDRFPFLCISDNIVVVKENKTWEEALDHCRHIATPSQPNLYYDLISVQPGVDYVDVMNKVNEADGDEVWTGLRFLAGSWVWVNGADMLYSGLPACPPEWRRCGVLIKNNKETVETRDCTERKNFLCYSAYKQ